MGKFTYIRLEAFIGTKTNDVVLVLPKRFKKLDPEDQRLLHNALAVPLCRKYENKFGNLCIKRIIS